MMMHGRRAKVGPGTTWIQQEPDEYTFAEDQHMSDLEAKMTECVLRATKILENESVKKYTEGYPSFASGENLTRIAVALFEQSTEKLYSVMSQDLERKINRLKEEKERGE